MRRVRCREEGGKEEEVRKNERRGKAGRINGGKRVGSGALRVGKSWEEGRKSDGRGREREGRTREREEGEER
jgi:hypothetical protein